MLVVRSTNGDDAEQTQKKDTWKEEEEEVIFQQSNFPVKQSSLNSFPFYVTIPFAVGGRHTTQNGKDNC